MTGLIKKLSYVLYGMLGITLVLTAMFFFLGDVPGEAYFTPKFTDVFLNWAKFLAISAAVLTVVFEIVNIVLNPQNGMRSLISIGVMLMIALVSYVLADSTPLVLSGYEGSDNVPSMLKMSGTFLYSTYFLLGGAVLAILVSELSKIFK